MLKLSEAIAGWSPAQRSARDPIALLEAGWAEIVGTEVAQNSEPARIADGTLTIVTRSSAWSHQLSFLGEHVLRAVAARLPDAGITRLRFRVGKIVQRQTAAVKRRRLAALREPARRDESASPAEALERFRRNVEDRDRTRRAAGWKACTGCGALLGPGSQPLCPACAAATVRERAAATARLLFEAPWLGFRGTAALVHGLKVEEYERIRTLLLSHWWGLLTQARNAKQLSRDGRERLVASSYVLLRSRIPPEEILPATVRSVLGDELHELLYDEPLGKGEIERNKKRKT